MLETFYEIPELGVHAYLVPVDDDKGDDVVQLSKPSFGSKSDKDKLMSDGDKMSTYVTDQRISSHRFMSLAFHRRKQPNMFCLKGSTCCWLKLLE